MNVRGLDHPQCYGPLVRHSRLEEMIDVEIPRGKKLGIFRKRGT